MSIPTERTYPAGFDFYLNDYIYIPVAVKIRGSIGKRWTYQLRANKQVRYPYTVPLDPKSPLQLKMRFLLQQGVRAWQSLTKEEKDVYRKKEPYHPIMSGYNFFLSSYIKTYL